MSDPNDDATNEAGEALVSLEPEAAAPEMDPIEIDDSLGQPSMTQSDPAVDVPAMPALGAGHVEPPLHVQPPSASAPPSATGHDMITRAPRGRRV